MTGKISKEKAIELVKGPLGDATLKSVAKYAAPIFWETRDVDDAITLTNGTIFVVDYGHGCFGVTANHVFEAFLDDKQKNPQTLCFIGPEDFDGGGKDALSFDIEERLIDRSIEIDIATFQFSREEAEKIGTSISTLWPPILPNVGQGVVFTGYPGLARQMLTPRDVSFSPYPALTIAETVTERQVSCQLKREYLVQAPGFHAPPKNFETGGMSGGPLFTVVEENGLTRWHLGGVIKEGNATFKIIYAAPSDRIQRNGTLRH